MTNIHPLKNLIQLQKQGTPVGIYSACSANEYVLEACMERAKATNTMVLIESTANQVNQYGGYTNMRPTDFKKFVESIALEVGLPFDQIILGGDHLGPLTWTNLPEAKAMEEAKELIRQYVLAGFTKIHLDTSMRVADDDATTPLSTATIARRGAILAEVAEQAYATLKKTNATAMAPVYIVGSEVPIPGGAQEEEEGIQVTKPLDFKNTINAFEDAFIELGLKEAWERVIAVVVQPGVEFGDETIHEYDQVASHELTNQLKKYPNVVFEGHSTDYQSRTALKEMVEDGIAILKVGPGLTFALREGLFALAHVENALFAGSTTKPSDFMNVLELAMLEQPGNWQHHYHGNEQQLAFKRQYSFSDRCRYYLPVQQVQTALHIMLNNLNNVAIPLSLLSAYMPIQYQKVRNHQLDLHPESLLKDFVVNCVDDYLFASNQELLSTINNA